GKAAQRLGISDYSARVLGERALAAYRDGAAAKRPTEGAMRVALIGRGTGARLGLLFFFQAEDGIRDKLVTGVQTCALPICGLGSRAPRSHDFTRIRDIPSRCANTAWLTPSESRSSRICLARYVPGWGTTIVLTVNICSG